MEETVTVKKGDKITAEWLEARPLGTFSLAGAQMKVAASGLRVTGTVAHVRGDHPTNPTKVVVFINQEGDWDGPTVRPPGCECERMHVAVPAGRIVEVVPAEG